MNQLKYFKMKTKEEELIEAMESIFTNTERIHGKSEALDWIKIAIHRSAEYINRVLYASEQCQKRDELLEISFRLIGEVIDNYEADAINLPAEMYNDLKFHLGQLKKQIQ